MIKKKHIRTIWFPAAILFFLTAGQRAAEADSFLNPARNTYSLDKTIDRPFLQRVPIPQVWQTDSTSEDFREALAAAVFPEDPRDRLFDILSLQSDIPDFQNDFQTIVIEDQKTDKNDISDVLNDMVPVLGEANDNVALDIDRLDRIYDAHQRILSQTDQDDFVHQMQDVQSFFMAIMNIIRIDLDLEKLDRIFKTKEILENRILDETEEGFMSDSVIDNAGDLYFSESKQMGGMKEYDDVTWALLFNDLFDLSTGINMISYDPVYLAEKTDESKRNSASLLDSAKKTDQIQGNDLVKEKQLLMQRLQKMLKNDKIKGVK